MQMMMICCKGTSPHSSKSTQLYLGHYCFILHVYVTNKSSCILLVSSFVKLFLTDYVLHNLLALSVL